MNKIHISKSSLLIGSGILLFFIIIGAVFLFSYRLAQETKSDTSQQLTEVSRQYGEDYKQVRKVRFTHKITGEVTEINIDGTVKQYDKFGKLLKTGRRGFAETQNIFKQYEWLVNHGQTIDGGNYRIDVETQAGTITYNPNGTGDGGDIVDETEDFIDDTINPTPTPRPSATPTPIPGTTPTPTPLASPTPLPDKPDYLNAPPFTCDDYYLPGTKPLRISGIYCGIE